MELPSVRHMNILLIFIVNEHMDNRYENLGLEYIASALRAKRHKVNLQSVTLEEIDWKAIVENKPDLIGFSLYYLNLNEVLFAAKKLKNLMPSVKIVLGGPHITLFGKEVMTKNRQLDYAIVGEGEHAVSELAAAIEHDAGFDTVKGLLYWRNGEYQENLTESIEDLDSLVFPTRELLKGSSAVISTSRGCINNCTFCSHKKFWPKWRGRSPENVVSEIEELIQQRNIRDFFIMDCSFEDPDSHAERMKDICRIIIDRKLSINFSTSFRATFYKKADKEARNLLKQAGLTAALVGIESGNEEDLQLYNKGTTVEDNHRIFALFHNMNCLLVPSFINFNPYSTIPRLRDNLNFLHRYKQSIRFFTFLDVFTYAPIYQQLYADGLVLEEKPGRGAYSYNYGMYDACVVNYRYADEKAGKVCEYCKKISQHTQQSMFADLSFYYERHQLQVRNLEQRLQEKDKPLISSYYEEFHCQMDILENVLFSWVSTLLDSANSGWGEEKFWQLTEERNVISLCDSIRNNLYSIRRKLMKAMIKRGYSIVG